MILLNRRKQHQGLMKQRRFELGEIVEKRPVVDDEVLKPPHVGSVETV